MRSRDLRSFRSPGPGLAVRVRGPGLRVRGRVLDERVHDGEARRRDASEEGLVPLGDQFPRSLLFSIHESNREQK